MANYKNIQIKMKGGKSRLQRVKVLASGKFKFVKNLRTRISRTRKASPSRRKGGRKTMARKKKRSGGGKSIARTAMKWIRVGALVANPIRIAMIPGASWEDKVTWIFQDYTGYNIQDGSFDAGRLAKGWGPYLMAVVATYGIPKIASIIRRL